MLGSCAYMACPTGMQACCVGGATDCVTSGTCGDAVLGCKFGSCGKFMVCCVNDTGSFCASDTCPF